MTNISNLNLSKGSIPPLLKYKIVFLGDQAVVKSSIINRFIYDIFVGNEHVHFLNYFRDQPYIRDAAVAVIVYDITSRPSFDSLQKWIDDVKHQRG